MDDYYRELILDHAKHRHNWNLLQPNDFDHEEHNPLCGDSLRLTLRLDEHGIIREIGWSGQGCAISQASASMFGELLIGMSFEDAKKLNKQIVLDLIGIPLTINRVKCATLALKTLVVGAYGTTEWLNLEDEE
jgi:nitrogen fixation protein NifU and related proteins